MDRVVRLAVKLQQAPRLCQIILDTSSPSLSHNPSILAASQGQGILDAVLIRSFDDPERQSFFHFRYFLFYHEALDSGTQLVVAQAEARLFMVQETAFRAVSNEVLERGIYGGSGIDPISLAGARGIETSQEGWRALNELLAESVKNRES